MLLTLSMVAALASQPMEGGGLRDVVWSPAGELIVARGSEILALDPDSGAVLRRVDTTFAHPASGVDSPAHLVVDEAAGWLAVSHAAGDPVAVYDVETFALLRRFLGTNDSPAAFVSVGLVWPANGQLCRGEIASGDVACWQVGRFTRRVVAAGGAAVAAYAGSGDPMFHFDAASGALVDWAQGPGLVDLEPFPDRSRVVGLRGGSASVYDAATGALLDSYDPSVPRALLDGALGGPGPGGSPLLYAVSDGDALYEIDLDAHAILRTWATPAAPVAVAARGGRVAVAAYGASSIRVLDVSTGAAHDLGGFGVGAANDVAVDASGARALIATRGYRTKSRGASVVDLASGAVQSLTWAAPAWDWERAVITPDGLVGWLQGMFDVVRLDLVSGAVDEVMHGEFSDLALAADGTPWASGADGLLDLATSAAIALPEPADVLVLDPTLPVAWTLQTWPSSLRRVDLGSGAVTGLVSFGDPGEAQPIAAAVAPDGSRLYVVVDGVGVEVVDAASLAVVDRFGPWPELQAAMLLDVALSADGGALYVSAASDGQARGGRLLTVDVGSGVVTGWCPSVDQPFGLAAAGDRVIVVGAWAGGRVFDVGEACMVDACASFGGDTDGDGRCDAVDDCPGVYDPDQADRDEDGLGDLCDLELTPGLASCPGAGVWTIHGAPGAEVKVLLSPTLGGLEVPGGRCAGTPLELGAGARVGPTVSLDATGAYEATLSLGAPRCGWFVQLIDMGSCAVSEVVQIPP